MKKIVASAITIIMILTLCTAAFAQAPNTNPGNGVKREEVKAKVPEAQGKLQEYKPQLDQIKENRKTIKSQEQEIRKLSQQIKSTIEEMIKNGENPDEATIDQLDELLDEINSHRQELAGTLGKIRIEELRMIQNRKEQGWDAFEENLNNIIEIQNTRIGEQKQIIEGLNEILQLL
ncbi:MAG: hypothetical protein QME46_01015 [Thermoanaerobacteraceae bacterium]|nr:hypothetical protein [Thermoanaerobacteraceae bacterium]